MRNDMKIGIIVGVLVILGVIIFLVSPGGNTQQKDVEIPAPLSDQETTPAKAPPISMPPGPKPTEIVVVPQEEQKPTAEKTEEISDKSDVNLLPEKLPTEPGEPEERQPRYYIVKEGDNLSSIAEQYFGHGKFWTVIHQANKDVIRNPDRLQVGWRLRIPYPDEVADKSP